MPVNLKFLNMVFILAGMHRSGTSMFARFMHESGINMGSEFYFDDSSNKYGHYEDMDFLILQRNELANQFGGEDWLVFHPFAHSDDFARKASLLFAKKADLNVENHWGWKDPRTTLFLKYWQTLNPEIRFIFLVRKPEAVVNSLCRLLKTRWSISQKAKYLKTYIHYNHEILTFCRQHGQSNVVVVDHEQLIGNPEAIIPKINSAVGFNFDPKLFQELFDKKVISDQQFIPYLFLGRLLRDARKSYESLMNYFV